MTEPTYFWDSPICSHEHNMKPMGKPWHGTDGKWHQTWYCTGCDYYEIRDV